MRPWFIGVAGGTASGKTTLATALTKRLGAALLSHDRYYHTVPPDRDPSSVNFDHPSSLETDRMVADLDRLRSGERCSVPVYDFATHRRRDASEWTALDPQPFVVVEGILLFTSPGVLERLDTRVFVDAPDDVRLARRITRDLHERGRDVHGVVAQYFATVRPMHEQFVIPSRGCAELVVDGTSPVEDLVARVLASLEEPS